jgi:hypothetical protein
MSMVPLCMYMTMHEHPHIYTKILYPHENAYKHNAGFWYV